jgi:hypothetical protein
MDIQEVPPIPKDLKEEDRLFVTSFVVPQGFIDEVNWVVYVDPKAYFSLPTLNDRFELSHAIGRVNEMMEDRHFILIGPGRWGSSNADLGVPVNYGDLYNAEALIELTGPGIGPAPEPSLGTHFFQDLMEANIFPLAIDLGDARSQFQSDWLEHNRNHLLDFSPADVRFVDCLRVVAVADIRPGHFLKVIMNDEKSIAVAFLSDDEDSLIG